MKEVHEDAEVTFPFYRKADMGNYFYTIYKIVSPTLEYSISRQVDDADTIATYNFERSREMMCESSNELEYTLGGGEYAATESDWLELRSEAMLFAAKTGDAE